MQEDDEDGPTITDLVVAATQGDGDAWRELVERFSLLVVSVARRYRLSAAATEDVAATVWLRAVQHLGDLREPQALPLWLIRTTQREALRQAAQDRRVQPQDPQESGWLGGAAVDDDPDAPLVEAERHAVLLSAIAELSATQRTLVLLLLEDPPLTYAEISRRTGRPVSSIGPTRMRALDRMRASIAVTTYLAGLDADLDALGGDRHDSALRQA